MSRLFNLALLLLLALGVGGCLGSPSGFRVPIAQSPLGESGREHFRIELAYVPDARLMQDTSPVWDLGRYAAAKGEERLVLVTRTTSYADLDEDDDEIVGTLRDRKVERVWLVIPAGTPPGKVPKVEDLKVKVNTGYEVDFLDGKGFLQGPYLIKGFVHALEEQGGMLVVIFDFEVRPNRPFLTEPWKVECTHALLRSETIQVK